MGLFGDVTRGLGDVATFGTNELVGNPIGKAGDSFQAGGFGGLVDSVSGATSAREANATNVMLAREGNAFASAQAQRQMDFQERMSGTAYQRVVADMRAAGVNPMLAVNNGGASTPGGAAGSPSVPTVAPVPTTLGGLFSTASSVMKTWADFKSSMASAAANRASAGASEAFAKKANVETDIATHRVPEAQIEGKIFSWFNQLLKDLTSPGSAKQKAAQPSMDPGFKVEWAQ